MNWICVLVIKEKKITLLSLLFHYDHFSSQKSSLRITKLERKIYFKSRNNQAIKASLNYGKSAYSYGLWDGVGADPAYSYQLLICDDPFYRGFLISAHTGGCFMTCTYWCSDVSASFFRTAFTNSHGQKGGVAFGEKGHDVHDIRRISIGLR